MANSEKMKVAYADDPTSGGGAGFLVFSDTDFPEPPLSFSIMRGSDHLYCTGTRAGWVGENKFLPIEEAPGPDGVLQAAIGPGIVDSLTTQETYKVALRGGDGSERTGRLRIGEITYTRDEALDNTGSRQEAKKAQLNDQVKDHSKKEEPKREEPEIPPAEAQAARPGREKPEEAVPQKLDLPEPQKRSRRGLWRVVILCLLVLGCLAWFFLDPRKNEEPKPEEKPGPVRIEEPQKPAPAQSAARGNRINFQGKHLTPAEAVALSREMLKEEKPDRDGIYRLWYFADKNGETSILLDYGACLDPAKPAWGTIGKDAPAAWEAYGRALEQNPDEAKKAREDLLAWLRQNASRDRQAQIWLTEIEGR